jgi:PAS domain S-box-containing protein
MDGIALLTKDGFIVDVSPAIEKILGLTKQELVNTDRLDFVVPEHLDIVNKTFREIITSPAHSITAEYQAITAAGDKKWIECTFTNLLDEPVINAVVLNFRDITDRKNAAEKNMFKANLLNTIGQAVVAIDLDGIITYWNTAAEKIYGWTKDETIGKSVMELELIDHLDEQASQIMEVLSAGQIWSGEYQVKRKDGTIFPAFVTDSPIYDDAMYWQE